MKFTREQVIAHNKRIAGDPSPMAPRAQAPFIKSAVCHEPLAAGRLQRGRERRLFVRFVQFTRNRQDPDNCCCKFALDWLRNKGFIPDDTDDDIALEVSQVQASEESEEGVLIELQSIAEFDEK